MICICINIYSVPLYIFANGTKTQSNMSLNIQQQKQCVFKYICTGRFLVSFRKQTQDFIILSSLQGHLMLCGNTFSYISSRLLLIASSNSTSSADLNSSPTEALFIPRLSSLSHSLVVSDMLFNKAHIISPSKW